MRAVLSVPPPSHFKQRLRPLLVHSCRARAFVSEAPNYFNTDAFHRDNQLAKELKTRIQVSGAITVAQYMQFCLSHPLFGFYNRSEVIGREGHFVTSPELSSVFGELIGLWLLLQWEALGRPSQVQLVEFGPGKGTLMKDALSAIRHFPEFYRSLDLYLLDASEHMIRKQQEAIGVILPPGAPAGPALQRKMRLPGAGGPMVHWVTDFKEVSSQWPTLVVAHEFLDAFPVHQFQYEKGLWKERLVSLDEKGEFQIVVSPNETNAAKILLRPEVAHIRQKRNYLTISPPLSSSSSSPPAVHKVISPAEIFLPDRTTINGAPIADGMVLEVGVEGCAWAQEIASRLETCGGSALIVDYGHNHSSEQSLRGISKHQFVSVLERPGEVDLSADVDFRALRRSVELLELYKAKAFGPIPQGYFLCGMGIEERVRMLLAKCKDPEEQERLAETSHRMVDRDQMGMIYKMFSITTTGLPAAFEDGEQYWNDLTI